MTVALLSIVTVTSLFVVAVTASFWIQNVLHGTTLWPFLSLLVSVSLTLLQNAVVF